MYIYIFIYSYLLVKLKDKITPKVFLIKHILYIYTISFDSRHQVPTYIKKKKI